MLIPRERLRALQFPVGSAVRFGTASYAAIALTFAQGLLQARILGPERTGVWLALQLLLTYGVNYHLGINDSVNRQLPMLEGKGLSARAAEYLRSAAGLLWILTVAWLVLGIAVAVGAYPQHRGGALVLACCTCLEVWAAFALTVLKAHSRFSLVGLLILTRAAVTLGLLPLVWRFGLPGVYARQVVVGLLILGLAWRSLPLSCAPRRNAQDFRQLLHDGMPLLAVGFTFSVQVSIDRALVASLLGTQALGQYWMAAMLLSVMIVLPGVVVQTAYPRMLQTFGATGSPRALRSGVLSHTALVAVAATVAAVAAALLMAPFTHAFLPRYEGGIRAAKWVLPGIVALSASMPSSYFLQTVRRQKLHLTVSAAALVLHVVLVVLTARHGGGIVAVAGATSLAYAVYAVGLFTAFLHLSKQTGSAS